MPVAANAILPQGNGPMGRSRGNKQRFFKTMTNDVWKSIDNQMKHVNKGYLSDPPKELVKIHRINPS
jgi:hypothetical protein